MTMIITGSLIFPGVPRPLRNFATALLRHEIANPSRPRGRARSGERVAATSVADELLVAVVVKVPVLPPVYAPVAVDSRALPRMRRQSYNPRMASEHNRNAGTEAKTRRTLNYAIFAVVAGLSVCAATARKATAQQQTSESSFARAVELQQSGDLEAAIRAYREFLQVDPQSVEALSNLGAVYARLGRHSEAVEQYRRALELDSHNIPIRFNLALAYYKSAQFPDAASELNQVVSAQPENQNAMLLLADCYLRMGENEKVIELLSPLQASRGSDQAFLYLLGTALIRERQPEGQVLVDKILRNGESAEAHLMLGTAELMANDDAGALKELARAIELNPSLPSAHAFYGRALLDTGNRSQAMEAFRRGAE
jgi:Tfp pilus assembly protein PilF